MAKTDHAMLSDDELEGLFRASRADAPDPSEAVMARILADAEAELAARAPTPAARPRAPRPGVWAALIGGIGGWPALAGMVTAAVAGVWLGFASPDQINTLAGGLLLPGTATVETGDVFDDLLPGYSGFESLAEEVQG